MQELGHIIAQLQPLPAPRGLRASILARIAAAAERTRKIREALFGTLSLLSALLLYPAFVALESELSRSAFASYLSLASTDGAALLSNWHEFLLSLVESAPIAGITFTLAALIALMVSLRGLAAYLPQRMARAVS